MYEDILSEQPISRESDAYHPGPFYKEVMAVVARQQNRDPEEWLLALYGLTIHYEGIELDKRSFFDFLDKSFCAVPVPFNEEWLSIVAAPDDPWFDRFVSDADSAQWEIWEVDGYQFAQDVLRFQAAEMHRMRGKQLDNDMRYFGLQSETGNYWFNFDPFGILECGAAGLDRINPGSPYNWALLGELLETGRIYE